MGDKSIYYYYFIIIDFVVVIIIIMIINISYNAIFQTSLEKTENEIMELSQNAVNLKSNFLELTELKHVLEKTETFFAEQEGANGTDSLTRALITEEPHTQASNVRGRLGLVLITFNAVLLNDKACILD
jgi:hypothetical protein